MNCIKKLFSWILPLLVGLLILTIILAFVSIWAANKYTPNFLARQVEKITHFRLSIREPHMRLQAGEVDFQNLTLENPATFPQPDFVDVNQFAVKVRLRSLLTDTIVVDKAALDINKIALVIGKNNKSNATTFVDSLPKSSDEKATKEKEPATKVKPRKKIFVKHLTVKLGTVEIADYSSTVAVKEKAAINYERTFENVDDLQDVVGPLVRDLQARGMTLFAKYFAAQVLKQPLDAVLRATEGVGDVAKGVTGVARGVGTTVGESIGGMLKAFKKPVSKEANESNDANE